MTSTSEITTEDVVRAIGRPVRDWAHQCHAVSLEIVKSDLFPTSRVARGSCVGVPGQHSWVIIGDDCYAPDAQILDATLWSYDSSMPILWRGTYEDGLHTPHGHGSIWAWGQPEAGEGDSVELAVEVSDEAQRFLALLGPLDLRGWMILAGAPVGGWPAAEIIAAMDDTPQLRAHVPIDRLGMLTDRNPSGLYQRSVP